MIQYEHLLRRPPRRGAGPPDRCDERLRFGSDSGGASVDPPGDREFLPGEPPDKDTVRVSILNPTTFE